MKSGLEFEYMTKQVKIFCLFVLMFLPLVVNANAELPDPTRPANFFVEDTEPIYVEEFNIETKEKISWKLSAIRISDKDRTAIVNGKLVRIGDEVSSAIVAEINPLSVVMNYEDKKLIVRLFENQVIKDYKTQ
jgi:hypothetical protein